MTKEETPPMDKHPSNTSIDDVMMQVSTKCPALAEHMYIDEQCLWYAGPPLWGDENKQSCENLKAIGFRFRPEGHILGFGLVSQWVHPCESLKRAKRKRHMRRTKTAPDTPERTQQSITDALAAL